MKRDLEVWSSEIPYIEMKSREKTHREARGWLWVDDRLGNQVAIRSSVGNLAPVSARLINTVRLEKRRTELPGAIRLVGNLRLYFVLRVLSSKCGHLVACACHGVRLEVK